MQGAPLSAKPLGVPGLPVKPAWKPALTVPPLGSAPPQDGLPTVTVVPDCDHTPFQPLLTVTVLPTVKVSRHDDRAGPLLVIRTSAVKPVDHWFAVHVTEQAPAGALLDGGTLEGGVLDGGTLDGGVLDGGVLDGGALDGGRLDGGVVTGPAASAMSYARCGTNWPAPAMQPSASPGSLIHRWAARIGALT